MMSLRVWFWCAVYISSYVVHKNFGADYHVREADKAAFLYKDRFGN